MKMNNLFALALMGMTAGFAVNAQAEEGCSSCKNEAELAGKKCGSATLTGNGNGNCSNLSQDEMGFSKKLSDKQRNAFCSKFTPAQRKQAMQMSCNTPMNCGSNRNNGKVIMKHDDAVSKIMKDNNISMEDKREELTEVK